MQGQVRTLRTILPLHINFLSSVLICNIQCNHLSLTTVGICECHPPVDISFTGAGSSGQGYQHRPGALMSRRAVDRSVPALLKRRHHSSWRLAELAPRGLF